MANPELAQRAYTAIMKHFMETGRAPHFTELADTLGVQPNEAKELQREAAAGGMGCWFVEGTDYIESWAPFYNNPTQYLITVDGQHRGYAQ